MHARIGVYYMQACIYTDIQTPNTYTSIHHHPFTLLQGASYLLLPNQVKEDSFITTLGKLLITVPI